MIKKLLEVLDNIQYANVDLEGLYKIRPAKFGVISTEEMKQVEDFLNLKGKSKDELTAIRNSIVKYYTDHSEELHQKANKDWEELIAKDPNANFSEFDKNCEYSIMQDQMSAFVAVIDHLSYNMNESNKVVGTIIEDENGFNIELDGEKLLVKSIPTLKQLFLDLAKYM